MKVLLVGHACSPRMGSEPSFTWNWAWHLSKYHQVWVIANPHDRGAVEEFQGEHPNPFLRFVWVTLPRGLDPWNSSRGPRGIRLHYLVWQHCVLSKAIQLHRQFDFDVAHHVSWGTISAPPLLWKLQIPLVWGPLGGAQTSPPAFRHYFGPAWPSEILRRFRVRVAPFLPPLRRAAQRSAAILATNKETALCLKMAGAREVISFIDTGIPSSFTLPAPLADRGSDNFDLLWAGGLMRRKALPLALEALSQVRDLPVRLLIAGDGPMKEEWVGLAQRLRLEDRTQFLGRVDWREMPALYQRANAFIFTSLRDSFCSQVVEAMAQSLPILTLDHQGVGDFVPPSAGIKVPITTPEETVAGLGQSIRRLFEFPEVCRKMGEAAWEYAQRHTWDQRAEWMSRLYEEIVDARRRSLTNPLYIPVERS